MPTPVGVAIPGFARFISQLTAMGPEFVAGIRLVNNEVAESVRARAQGNAEAEGGVAAKAAASLRTSNSKSYASIRLGGNNAPYALGAEFGSIRFKQFKPWRGNQWRDGPGEGVGYFLYPAIRELEPDILAKYVEVIDVIATRVFPIP